MVGFSSFYFCRLLTVDMNGCLRVFRWNVLILTFSLQETEDIILKLLRWVCINKYCLCYVIITQLLCCSIRALPFRMSIWLCFLQKIWSIIRLSWNGGIEFGPMLSLLHVSYRLEEITTSQWRFCQLWNLVVCNWGFRPSWSTISVTSLVRLLFCLIPYIFVQVSKVSGVLVCGHTALEPFKKFKGQQLV